MKSWSVIGLPSWSISLNGPPIADGPGWPILGREQNNAEENDKAGQEGGEDQQNMRRSGRHLASLGLHQKHAVQPVRTISKNTAVP